VHLYVEAGLVDGRTIAILFESHYRWYEPFFHEFLAEYQAQLRPEQPQPAWLTALPRLEGVFGGSIAG
jgi:hypothetical protein